MVLHFDFATLSYLRCTCNAYIICVVLATQMSLIKAVVDADDQMIARAHKMFADWKKKNLHQAKTEFGYALRHFRSCARPITRNCPTFKSKMSYARAIATTRVCDGKIYWKSHNDKGWKMANKTPPPIPRNGAKMRVLFSKQRDTIYRYWYDCFFCFMRAYFFRFV